MLEEAWKLLELQFDNCYNIVKDDDFYRGYALEKLRHSKQVAGAGNYIIPEISWLKDKSAEYVEMVRTAVLLHDVCRFTEIVYRFENKGKYDHGFGGGELLKNTALFNDIRIWLPVKYHGHLIEDLYKDGLYQSLAGNGLQKEVELICFIIRDADKIANLNMMVNEPGVLPLFLGESCGDKNKDGSVSEVVKDSALRCETAPRFDGASVADHITGYISWFTDMNYQYSMDYCNKLNIVEKLFGLFDRCCTDEEFKQKYTVIMREYLRSHEFLR